MVAQDTGEKITEGKVRKTSSTSTPAGSREREEKAERSVKGQKEKKLRRKNPKKNGVASSLLEILQLPIRKLSHRCWISQSSVGGAAPAQSLCCTSISKKKKKEAKKDMFLQLLS